jgi:hypothetical protein
VRDVGSDAALYARLCEALGHVGVSVIAGAGCHGHTIRLNFKRMKQARKCVENLAHHQGHLCWGWRSDLVHPLRTQTHTIRRLLGQCGTCVCARACVSALTHNPDKASRRVLTCADAVAPACMAATRRRRQRAARARSLSTLQST